MGIFREGRFALVRRTDEDYCSAHRTAKQAARATTDYVALRALTSPRENLLRSASAVLSMAVHASGINAPNCQKPWIEPGYTFAVA
jgi:hypothetical protein